MNDFVIKVSKLNRSVTSCESFIGLDGENLVENLIFIFTDTFVDGNARLEYIVNDEKYFIELNKGNNYYSIPIKNVITKEGNIEMQLVISKPSENNEIIVFKSDIFTVYCKKSINAVEEAPDGYVVWLDHANEILRQMENLNIIAYKENGITYIVITSKEGVSTTYQIKDGKNGKNGLDGEKGEDGNGIIKIEKTGTQDNVDTYTIYYTNGTTSTFTVTNSTVTDEEFEALQQEVDKYKTLANILPRVSGTGTEISLENSGEGTPLEIDLEGQTSQESTTGKNLLPKATTSETKNGLTFAANEDGSIKVSGTATATTYYNLTKQTLQAGTYTLSGGVNSNCKIISKYGSSYQTSQGTGVTFTLSEETTPTEFYIQITNGTAITTPVIFYPMISTNGGDYEPYTGGIPAPNPEFPYPIKKATGDNNVKVQNKNFFKDKYKNGVADLVVGSDLTNTEINLALDSAVGKTIVTLGCYLKAGTYTLSNVSSTYISFNRIAIAGTTCVGSSIHLRNSYTWTQNVDGYTYFGIEGDAGETSYTDTPIASELKLQIENGSTATTYVEHEEQNFPLTLGDLEVYEDGEFIKTTGKNLFSTKTNNLFTNNDHEYLLSASNVYGVIGEVKPNTTYTVKKYGGNRFWVVGTIEYPQNNTPIIERYISDNSANEITFTTGANINYVFCYYSNASADVDIQLEQGSSPTEYEPYGTDEWYLKNYYGKVVLDGSENWQNWNMVTTEPLVGFILDGYVDYDNSSGTDVRGLSNYFKVFANAMPTQQSIGLRQTGDSIKRIYLAISNEIVSNLTEFKSWLSNHNTELVYLSATPTFTKITSQTLIDELENLKNNAKSYKDVTNISQTNDELPFIITASAFKDLSNL